MDNVTKQAIKRFLANKYSPDVLRMLSKIKNYRDNEIDLDELEKMAKNREENEDFDLNKLVNIPCVLIINKIDLCTNKRKLRELQEELEDLGAFDRTFHVSAETGII